jgi:hypothetical protein
MRRGAIASVLHDLCLYRWEMDGSVRLDPDEGERLVREEFGS